MMRYTVFITQTTKYAIDVEADDPQTADSMSWDLMDSDDASAQDSDATIDYMQDENKRTYLYNRNSGWKMEPQRNAALRARIPPARDNER
jgi:hypothetical protein